MLTLLITVLLSVGLIDSADDFDSLSPAEQNDLSEIIIEEGAVF